MVLKSKTMETTDLKKFVVSPVPENQEDSSDFYVSSGFYVQYVDIEGVYKSEYDLIKRYREMHRIPKWMVLLRMLLTSNRF